MLFNNAAIQIACREDYWNTSIEDFEMSFRINFISVATICHRLIPTMIERGFGRIVNTTSGRFFHAQNFTGLTLEEAVAKAEQIESNPYII
ncbi:hypothetical protein DCC85_10220 [Paenibacillus sp. CAA11]|uniref:SDR family NAD(P)-dependent oxidoreductase n=1 Tax=Paenibacillus sp. CAA11 TaxID=1532905 RepID=UPI000D3685CB|nr:SDR family NAD(P)-dependent oxidoreductase [Paenibacillus sp. CAA11]AWB44564.1 hypothetical protein DCC85_10220 [Paenibacillus sp. CAA11]